MRHNRILVVAALLVSLALPIYALAQDDETPTFGGPEDVAFAERLWRALADDRLVGPRSIIAQPYEGSEPHGVILMTVNSEINVDRREAAVIVKKNYMGENISIESVATNPNLFLAAITVMFRREAGYDPENQDWFWVKYKADGTLHRNPRGLLLAGRVAKNPEDACLACHRFAPGDDYVFLHDRFAALTPGTGVGPAEEPAETFTGLKPLAEQPDPAAREPGLAVTYYFGIFNLVDEIVEVAKLEEGQRGPAIPALDYKVGSGAVLTSGRADGVGADIRGLINFSRAGTYMMALQSNDGVRLELGGKLLFSDEGVHADRFSKLVPVEIETPGWYPLSILYFEKRNTATLQLYWTRPGDQGGLTFVPPDAFAHLSK